jgi:hypothetical protein
VLKGVKKYILGSHVKCPLFSSVVAKFFQNNKLWNMCVVVLKFFHIQVGGWVDGWMDGSRNFNGQAVGMKTLLEKQS